MIAKYINIFIVSDTRVLNEFSLLKQNTIYWTDILFLWYILWESLAPGRPSFNIHFDFFDVYIGNHVILAFRIQQVVPNPGYQRYAYRTSLEAMPVMPFGFPLYLYIRIHFMLSFELTIKSIVGISKKSIFKGIESKDRFCRFVYIFRNHWLSFWLKLKLFSVKWVIACADPVLNAWQPDQHQFQHQLLLVLSEQQSTQYPVLLEWEWAQPPQGCRTTPLFHWVTSFSSNKFVHKF